MANTIKIFVEGDADFKFIGDYLSHILPNFEISKETIEKSGGWTTINAQTREGEAIRNGMYHNTDNAGVNLVIFDADKNFIDRKCQIEDWKNKYGLAFELFLFPDNQNTGTLEELLEKIIIDANQPIFDCWNGFENCLHHASQTMGKNLTIPAKKTKIYAYLEVLLGETKKEKELIKDPNRDYKNREHWNLDSESLIPLRDFLLKYIQ